MRHRLAAFCLSWLLYAAGAAHAQAAERPDGISADGAPDRLVLALDGIPFDVFVDLQQRGYFAEFRPVARMVSTFPSLSDVSFAAIGGGEPPDGYQVMRFDQQQNRVVGNTLGSLSGRSHPNLQADSSTHSSLHRMVGYMAAYPVSLFDLREIEHEVLGSNKQTFVAYLEESDALLHVEGRPGAEKFLIRLDTFLQELQAKVRARAGRELLIDLVSDHGSTMLKGEVVPVGQVLGRCGFHRRNRIRDPYDVAYSMAGIIGSVAVTVPRENVEAAARCLAVADGIDLVAVDRGDAVGILTAGGEAEVRLVSTVPEQYDYRSLHGDPLGLLDGPTTERRFEQSALFRATLDAPRPDPLRRLWRAFHGEVKEASPLLVSLSDGREAGNGEVRTLARIRGRAGTHGSMTRLASLGILASNWRKVEDVDSWSANEALFGAGTVSALRRVVQQRSARAEPPPSPAPMQTGR